jgi:two-component system, chemotaxis family, protein-glutamate methylesterase/glutaminase
MLAPEVIGMNGLQRDVIVIGASAGGLAALKELVAGLPAELEAAVFVVLHLGANDDSHLHEILQKHSKLLVVQAKDGESIRRGVIFVARPDCHLVLEKDVVRLTQGPREKRHRPAIDALFRSAASVFESRVIGVILSGTLDDGSAGLWWIKQRGGTAVVQDPRDAEFSAMPDNAIAQVNTDHIVPVREMPQLLVRLVKEGGGVPSSNVILVTTTR